MVQVLPYVPGFGEKLAEVISQAGGHIAQGYGKKLENERAQKNLDIITNPNASPLQKLIAKTKLPEQYQKYSDKSFASVLGPEAQAAAQNGQLNQIFGPAQGQQTQGKSPIQNLMSAIQPSQPSQLPNSTAQQNAQLIQNPSGNPQMNPQAMPNQTTGQASPQQMNRNDPSTWPDEVLDQVAGIGGPSGAVAKGEKERRAQQQQQQFQRNLQNEGIRVRADETNKAQTAKENRAEIRKYAEPYEDKAKIELNLNKLEAAKDLIKSGKVSIDDNWLRNAAAAIAEGNDSLLSEFVKTDEQQQLWYLLRDSLKPKEIGGSNPSTKEVLLAYSALPNPYKGQKANEFIIDKMINAAKTDLKKSNLILREREKGVNNPGQFKATIEEGVSKYQQKLNQKLGKKQVSNQPAKPGFVWMLDPYGVARQIPENAVEMAISNKGKRL